MISVRGVRGGLGFGGLLVLQVLVACSGDPIPMLYADAGAEPRDASAEPRDAAVSKGAFASFPAYESPKASGAAGSVQTEPEDEAAAIFDQTRCARTTWSSRPRISRTSTTAIPRPRRTSRACSSSTAQTYGPLGIRYKGSVGAFLPPCTS